MRIHVGCVMTVWNVFNYRRLIEINEILKNQNFSAAILSRQLFMYYIFSIFLRAILWETWLSSFSQYHSYNEFIFIQWILHFLDIANSCISEWYYSFACLLHVISVVSRNGDAAVILLLRGISTQRHFSSTHRDRMHTRVPTGCVTRGWKKNKYTRRVIPFFPLAPPPTCHQPFLRRALRLHAPVGFLLPRRAVDRYSVGGSPHDERRIEEWSSRTSWMSVM